MSYPPIRHQNENHFETEGGYDRERRRGHREDERDWRREPERFRRDHAASFADEDRPFDEEASRFAGRDRDLRFEDWERPRRFGTQQYDQGEQSGYFQRSASGPFDQRESGSGVHNRLRVDDSSKQQTSQSSSSQASTRQSSGRSAS